LQVINHWIQSKETNFLAANGIDKTYFFALEDVVGFIENFRDAHKALPNADTVSVEFEDFRKLTDLEPMSYLVGVMKEAKAYTEFTPVLQHSAELLNAGKTLESMFKLRADTDTLIKKYASTVQQYDWVRNAVDRYNEYMKKHGKEGLAGLPTGIPELDELTGGWLEDDLILLAGRLNEGKSLIGSFFAFKVWLELKKAEIDRPVVLISTEMSALEIAYRLDTLKAHFSNRGMREGKLLNHDLYREYLEALHKEKTGFIVLSQEANGGSPFKTTDILSVVESERPAFLVVDQLYDIVDVRGDWDIRRRIVNATREIRDINLMTKTPTMVLVQAGREAAKDARKNADATPEIDQVQESDAPAQKATRALTLRKTGDIFKLSLKKNRGGEKDKDIYMRADIDKGLYEPISEKEMVF
jgi:replicative DNA helicase